MQSFLSRAALVCSVWAGMCLGADVPKDRNALPEDGITSIVYLDQNWDASDSQQFYFTSQGSHIVPYDWFLILEQPDSTALFTDPKYITKFRYLTQKSDNLNPDGLPVGFVKDQPTEADKPWLGFTCAACHTNQINYHGVGYRVDGAPTLGDVQGFLTALALALQKTYDNPAKFDRFAAALRKTEADKADLKTDLKMILDRRTGYNKRNFMSDHPAGNGRIDAFGAIFNEVSHILVKNPPKTSGADDNPTANTNPANAPVSYPTLWDTPQHDFVQWVGTIPNGGRFDINSLARNVGEVIGVFGIIEIGGSIFGNKTSIRFKNLGALERSLRDLWSPLWPETIAPLDQPLVSKGRTIFMREDCSKCHNDIVRDSPTRAVTARVSSEGTDILTFQNFTKNTSLTGVLEGRIVDYIPRQFPPPLFPKDFSTSKILDNVVIGSIIGSKRAAPGDELSKFSFSLHRFNITKFDAGMPPVPQPGYKARPLNGIWATAPYLHNGSIPNLWNLFLPPNQRMKTFKVGSREYDPKNVGFQTDGDGFEFDTTFPGNSNSGHTEGTTLSAEERWALIEYLKSL